MPVTTVNGRVVKLHGGGDCGTGAGGFKAGNQCAKGASGEAGKKSPKEITPDANEEESGKPIESVGYRYGAPAGDVTFYSREKDYAEEYAVERGGKREDVKSYDVKLENPLVVDAPVRGFSDPRYEAPIIREAKQNGYDGVVFRRRDDGYEDVFFVVFATKPTEE